MVKKKTEEGIPKQYRTKSFQDLQAKWYKKLEAEGFEELEWSQPGGQNSHFLKKPLSRIANTYNESTVEHYRRCGIHFNGVNWRGRLLDKYIFQCYTEGVSYRGIIKLIIKRRGFRKKPYSLTYIYTRIHIILNEMNTKKLWEVED